MHAMTVSKQVTIDKGIYLKNRLQIPLPKTALSDIYNVVLDDEAHVGILYGKDVEPWRVQLALIPISPIGASVGLLMERLANLKIIPQYLAITGSLARGDYQPETSDVDMALVVKDGDAPKVQQLRKTLPPVIDLIIMSESAALHSAGTGLDRLALIYANVLIDSLDLQKKIKRAHVDWKSVRYVLEAELELLQGCYESIQLALTREERASCAYHLLLRLRAVHLVECLLKGLIPTKKILYSTLEKYSVPRKLIQDLYLASRITHPVRHDVIPSRKQLIMIADGTRKYGKELNDKLIAPSN